MLRNFNFPNVFNWPDRGAFLESLAGTVGVSGTVELMSHDNSAAVIALGVLSAAVTLHGVSRYSIPNEHAPLTPAPEEEQS